jgi:hypothetical protein
MDNMNQPNSNNTIKFPTILSGILLIIFIVGITLFKEYSQKRIKENVIEEVSKEYGLDNNKTDIVETAIEDTKSQSVNSTTPELPVSYPIVENSTKYAFVVIGYYVDEIDPDKPMALMKAGITPTQENIKTRKNKSIISDIKTFSVFTEDIKYQFMDEIQQDAINSHNSHTSYEQKHVISRDCFQFTSYAEASKAREKYITE